MTHTPATSAQNFTSCALAIVPSHDPNACDKGEITRLFHEKFTTHLGKNSPLNVHTMAFSHIEGDTVVFSVSPAGLVTARELVGQIGCVWNQTFPNYSIKTVQLILRDALRTMPKSNPEKVVVTVPQLWASVAKHYCELHTPEGPCSVAKLLEQMEVRSIYNTGPRNKQVSMYITDALGDAHLLNHISWRDLLAAWQTQDAEIQSIHIRVAWGVYYRELSITLTENMPSDATLESLLRDIRSQTGIKIADVQHAICKHFGVSMDDLCGATRKRSITKPRQIAMYLAQIMTPHSLPKIGTRFGGRDHTTVLHAVRKIGGLRQTDDLLSQQIEKLIAALTA